MDNSTNKRIVQAKAYNYTPVRALCEFIDNIKNDTKKIKICLKVNTDSNFYEIAISDDSQIAFNNQDLENVFSWTCLGQTENELSNFGVGFKSAAVNLGNRLELVCSKDGKYYYVDSNVQKFIMNDSLKPEIHDISIGYFKKKHGFDINYGSSFIISELDNKLFNHNDDNNVEEKFNNLVQEFKEYYNFMVEEKNINIIFELNYGKTTIQKELNNKTNFDFYKYYKNNKKSIIENLKNYGFKDNIENILSYECDIYIKEKDSSFQTYLVDLDNNVYESGKKMFKKVPY
jgi:hypothetical protein